MTSRNQIVANALNSVVMNKSQNVVRKMQEAFQHIQEAQTALQYTKVIITREEQAENEDVAAAVPALDALISQTKKMTRDFLGISRKLM